MARESLTINCDTSLWEDLDYEEKFKMEIRASIDPVYFWNHPAMGGIKLWDKQAAILRDFYKRDNEDKRIYNELLFDAGRRGGKTFTASLIILTELYMLLLKSSPQQYYNMAPGGKITLFVSSASVDQTLRTIFPEVTARLTSSPWFMQFNDVIRPVAKFIQFPKNIVIEAVGSNMSTAQGRTIKCYVAEEINSVGNEDGKITPQELYNKVSKGTVSFAPFHEDIRVAISSQVNEYDFLSQRIRHTLDNEIPGVLVVKANTLDLNPNLTEEILEVEKMRDEDSYNAEFGLGAVTKANRYFRKNTISRLKFGPNLFDVPEIVSVTRQEEFVPTFNPEDFKYDKEASYYLMSIDPAVVNDPLGLAVMHLTVNGEIKVDGATVFRSAKGHSINAAEVKRFVLKIVNTIPIEKYVYDTYMYSDIREEVGKRGIELIQHNIKIDDWEQFKDQIGMGAIEIPKSDYLMKEITELVNKGNKVDHPNSGTKDMLDAIVNGATTPFRGDTEVVVPNMIMGTAMQYR